MGEGGGQGGVSGRLPEDGSGGPARATRGGAARPGPRQFACSAAPPANNYVRKLRGGGARPALLCPRAAGMRLPKVCASCPQNNVRRAR
eukprot:scaffold2640_cov376-Prasinococcus_capsulatus_cf.AAC.9